MEKQRGREREGEQRKGRDGEKDVCGRLSKGWRERTEEINTVLEKQKSHR